MTFLTGTKLVGFAGIFFFTVNLTACSSFSPATLIGLDGGERSDSRELDHPQFNPPAELNSSSTGRYFVPLRESDTLPIPPRQFNSYVERELRAYLQGSKRHIREALKLRKEHMRELGLLLRREGVPVDLLNMAIVESGFNNKIKSHAGAAGVWQFMASTARNYGLKVNLLVDERRNVRLATIAAARHLRDLYMRYSDWNLAIAAYNAGPGTIDKLVRNRSERDFWKLAETGTLKVETVRHVAKFLAVTLIADDPESFGVHGVN